MDSCLGINHQYKGGVKFNQIQLKMLKYRSLLVSRFNRIKERVSQIYRRYWNLNSSVYAKFKRKKYKKKNSKMKNKELNPQKN